MAHQPHILRVAVDQDQHTGRRTAAHTTHRHTAGRTGRNAVTHHPATGDEEARHPLGQCRQQRRSITLCQTLPPDDGNANGQSPQVGNLATARDDHFIDRLYLFIPQRIRGFSLCTPHPGHAARKQHSNPVDFHLE